LKPENILLDERGHLKLTDFGLSKIDFKSSDLSESFCGSPEYMSPEMLNSQCHGRSLDIYSLGALLYEMVCGLPPHYNSNRFKMYQDIAGKPESYPSYVSFNCQNLMQKLLKKNPNDRISIPEIKKHPFFSTINWDKIYNKEIEPPIKVDIFRSNFDSEYTKKPININIEDEESDS